MLIRGDLFDVLPTLDAESVDAVVSDPPYGIGFMNKEWDSFKPGEETKRIVPNKAVESDNPNVAGRTRSPASSPSAVEYDRTLLGQREFQDWTERWAREVYRVLKPGGYALVSGAPRSFHRMACGLEDAGFVVRDCLSWLYGSGFPKSLNISKAIDAAAGAEREVVGRRTDGRYAHGFSDAARRPTGGHLGDEDAQRIGGFVTDKAIITAAATDEAREWDGWGTALKPGWEPIVVARKPLRGTVAANVLTYGTGGLNIDACRLGFISEADESEAKTKNRHADFGTGPRENRIFGRDERDRGASGNYDPVGRWPPNVAMDEDAAAMLDEQSGELTSGANPTRRSSDKFRDIFGAFAGQEACEPARGADVGSASRFFYVAKPSRSERDFGTDGLIERARDDSRKTGNPGGDNPRNRGLQPRGNFHPTVKPVELMRWLVRLVTPIGGVVLDPFTGSGTTGMACVYEQRQFIGIEREPEYADIAERRIANVAPLFTESA